ncbi:hypothetical protein [Microbacterium elymi]|uniref:Uncharacterized protein n=1 Tax=Microbacterium elymi TaxID=2909587 RepID=A0ABY5NIK3_9MICO|nr:hypothetical protein [Microbacterium elymi]UUT34995.1 hypothetical protein L2X98_32105 [Microbacterium elymi]
MDDLTGMIVLITGGGRGIGGVLGAIPVTEAMLPLLRRSPRPRIVNVSSSVGSLERMSDTDHYFTTGIRGVTAAEAASVIVDLATLEDDGPTGTYRSAGGTVPW